MPFVKPYRGKIGCRPRDLVREHRGVLVHHRALVIAAAIVTSIARGPIIADHFSDESIRVANLSDSWGPNVVDILDTDIVRHHRFQFLKRMIDREFNARVDAAIASVAIIVDGRMERLARIADVVREVARETEHRITIAVPPSVLELIANRHDGPRQVARALERAIGEATPHLLDVGIKRRPRVAPEPFDVDVVPAVLGLAELLLEDRIGLDRMQLQRGFMMREC